MITRLLEVFRYVCLKSNENCVGCIAAHNNKHERQMLPSNGFELPVLCHSISSIHNINNNLVLHLIVGSGYCEQYFSFTVTFVSILILYNMIPNFDA